MFRVRKAIFDTCSRCSGTSATRAWTATISACIYLYGGFPKIGGPTVVL